jgi:hypothetical protein
MQQWLLVTEDFYILTMLTLKISLGVFFLRIVIKTWEKRVVYVTLGIATLFNVAYFFFAVFQCGIFKNANEFWIKLSSNRCITPPQAVGVSYTHAIITTITDWVFAILPLAMLKESQLARREKIIVGFILTLGAM